MYLCAYTAHHWHRFCGQKYHLQRNHVQTAVVGHCRSRAFQESHSFILEGCSMCDFRVRCCQYFLHKVDPDTLTNLPEWIELFKNNRGDKAMSLICGNKSDLEKYSWVYLGTSIRKSYNQSCRSISCPFTQFLPKQVKILRIFFSAWWT